MKKLLLIMALGLGLGACSTLQTDWSIVTGSSVSPTQIIVASNAFDAAEGSATQYLLYCKANKAASVCALATRKKVVAAVRAGRTARNQLEPYITSGTAGPLAIYNTLIATVQTLQTTTPTTGAGL